MKNTEIVTDRKLYISLGYKHVDSVSGVGELSNINGDYIVTNPKMFLDDKFELGEKTDFSKVVSLDTTIAKLEPEKNYLLVIHPPPTSENLKIYEDACCISLYQLNKRDCSM